MNHQSSMGKKNFKVSFGSKYVQSDIVGKYLITFFFLKEPLSDRVKDIA